MKERLISSKKWYCQLCGHLETHSEVQCGKCKYLRLGYGIKVPWIEAETPVHRTPKSSLPTSSSTSSPPESSTDSDLDEEVLIDLAFSHLQRLFERAAQEGEDLSDREQAEIYRSLLGSFLKLERQKIRHFLIEHEQEQDRQRNLRKLSLVWFLGILFGLVLAFMLSQVR